MSLEMTDAIKKFNEAWDAFIIAFGEALGLDKVLDWMARILR